MSAISSAPGQEISEPPLVVDLDGTLLHTDSLFEGVAQLLKRDPRSMLAVPRWLLDGRATLKREIAHRTSLDMASLPYDPQLLAFLEARRGRCKLVLCTAAHRRVADAVAAHLGMFDEVIATYGRNNLRGHAKARALVERFGVAGFDYAGNDTSDLPVFAQARRAIVVNPTPALRWRLGRIDNIEQVIGARRALPFASHLRAMRPHQWIKNLLVYLPTLAAIDTTGPGAIWPGTLAFLAFCLVASSVYLANDLLDVSADRRHPRKRNRPFAAGLLPIPHGLVMIPALLTAGMLLATMLPAAFVGVLTLYYLSSNLYSFWLKRVPLLDTLVLAGLYTLRILGGAAAIRVIPSVWLLAFSMFFFLSIALAKRHSELVEGEGTGPGASIPGREYRPEDLGTLISQGSASGYAAVLVLALYINDAKEQTRYNHPEIIWLICPLLLYWINKLWLNSQRREIREDPVIWAIRNRVSRSIAILSVLLLLLARWLPASP
jgi:4-hydroxybenzoate polyprenyltransferase/phosphoserine phosphatase